MGRTACPVEYSALVHPLLRDLRRGAARRLAPEPAAVSAPDPDPAPFARVRLRRDGARPLVFEGIEIVSAGAPRLTLYRTRDGRAAVQIVEPSAAGRRARHIAAMVDAPEDLHGLLRLCPPQGALPLAPT